MPHPQTNVRLSADTKARAIAAAKAEGISLSAWIENAAIAYLDGVGDLVSGDSSEIPALKEMVSELVSRVENLEGMARSAAPVAPNASPVAPPAPGEGLSIGAALIAANAPIPPAQSASGNRDRAMRQATGQPARDWLQAQGWTLRGREWFSPPRSQD